MKTIKIILPKLLIGKRICPIPKNVPEIINIKQSERFVWIKPHQQHCKRESQQTLRKPNLESFVALD
jgi:hypothetical protein